MDKNLKGLFFILGGLAAILIITGLALPSALKLLSIDISAKILYLFQSAFILSGILDIGLIIYAKKKLG